MKPTELQNLGVYRMKDGKHRKVIGMFWGDDPQNAEIEYVACNEDGHEMGSQKPKYCGNKTFLKLAIELVGVGSKYNGVWEHGQ